MRMRNDANERLKWEYAEHLQHARGRGEATIDDALSAILRFEQHTSFRDFKTYRPPQAQAFKRKLAETKGTTGRPLSAASRASIMKHLRNFFLWLRERPGHKRITVGDCDYFSLSRAEETMAAATKPKVIPTLDQIRAVLRAMPNQSPIDRRNRALIAFLALTGARADAVASFKLQHVDVAGRFVDQAGTEVRTKFRKTFRTYFVVLDKEILDAFVDYVAFLKQELLWGPTDPLFPATKLALGPDRRFRPVGLARRAWSGTGPVREIIKPAFERVGLPYASPHRFRDMLVQMGERECRTPEEFKAWSQNIGHDGVLTTFTSYGAVPTYRQGEIIARLGVEQASPPAVAAADADDAEVLRMLQKLMIKREGR
ncbi:tyrosine-type recombinase/integrase [Alsobacter sp. R-9]